jgi:hypothetical protein
MGLYEYHGMLAKVVLNRLSAQEGRMMMIATWSEGEMKDRTVCVPRSNSTRSETEE